MTDVMAVGLAAGFCTTISFLPQVIKTWRSHSTADISLGMFIVFSIGTLLWLTYGMLKHDIAIIAPNVITFALSTFILGYKLRCG